MPKSQHNYILNSSLQSDKVGQSGTPKKLAQLTQYVGKKWIGGHRQQAPIFH